MSFSLWRQNRHCSTGTAAVSIFPPRWQQQKAW